MNITLTNDFHNTSATVRPVNGLISRRSFLRASKKLCGIDGCTCGIIRGQGNPFVAQYDSEGSQFIVE